VVAALPGTERQPGTGFATTTSRTGAPCSSRQLLQRQGGRSPAGAGDGGAQNASAGWTSQGQGYREGASGLPGQAPAAGDGCQTGSQPICSRRFDQPARRRRRSAAGAASASQITGLSPDGTGRSDRSGRSHAIGASSTRLNTPSRAASSSAKPGPPHFDRGDPSW